MKNFYLLAILLIIATQGFTQKLVDPKAVKVLTDTKLLPSEAFDKMIIQDITYTIFGESSLASGIKVDISKPEATISGVFQSKRKPRILIGLEFKGGISDKSFSILKGQNTFNTQFEFKPSLYYILGMNSAKYYKYKRPILVAKNELIALDAIKIKDTLLVAALINNAHLKDFKDFQDTIRTLPNSKTITSDQKPILEHLLKRFLKERAINLENLSFDELMNLVPQADSTQMSTTYIYDIHEFI